MTSALKSTEQSRWPWLDGAPSQWEIAPIKAKATVRNGATPSSGEERFWDGDIPWATPVDLGVLELRETGRAITREGYESCGTSLVPAGSLIVSTRAPIGSLALAGVDMCFNQGCRGLVPGESVSGRFLYYALSAFASVLQIHGEGTTFKELSSSSLADFPLAWPPRSEQTGIASYLDAETARIDGLIDDKQALVDSLKEMRRSSVAEAITKGVHGTRAMRPSGLSWVADIPADWRTLSLKRFVRLSGGHTPATGNPAYWDGSVPWFSPKDMKADELHDSIDHVTDLAVDESGLRVIDPGTTMIVVRGMILAHTFPVCVAQVKATINQDMKALVPEEDVHQRFLPWLLRGASALFLSLTEQSAHGTMALRTDRFMGEKLPIPPLDEQLEIVEHLEAERQRIDLLLRQVDDEIGLLRELRAATITDAVLGRIDVREYKKN